MYRKRQREAAQQQQQHQQQSSDDRYYDSPGSGTSSYANTRNKHHAHNTPECSYQTVSSKSNSKNKRKSSVQSQCRPTCQSPCQHNSTSHSAYTQQSRSRPTSNRSFSRNRRSRRRLFPSESIAVFTHLAVICLTVFLLFSLTRYAYDWVWLYGTFFFILVNGIIGILKYEDKTFKEDWKNIYRTTMFVSTLYALPCLYTSLLLMYGDNWEYAVVVVIIPIFSLIVFFVHADCCQPLVDGLVLGYVICVSSAASQHHNSHGVMAAIIYGVTHFGIRTGALEEVPLDIMYNLGIGTFSCLAMKAYSNSFNQGDMGEVTVTFNCTNLIECDM